MTAMTTPAGGCCGRRGAPRSRPRSAAAMSAPSSRAISCDAGRRGDVDLGQVVADHVDADEDQPRRARSARCLADLAVARGQPVFYGLPPTCMLERASPSAGTRLTAPDRLAVDQDDALVALPHLGKVALRHDRLALDSCENISSSELRFSSPGRRRNTPAPPLPNSGFRMMSLCSFRNSRISLAVGGDQGRRHQFAKPRDEQLFRRVAHRGRVVDHERLRLGALQQVRGGDVGHVERRVLPHQHDVEPFEIEFLEFAER